MSGGAVAYAARLGTQKERIYIMEERAKMSAVKGFIKGFKDLIAQKPEEVKVIIEPRWLDDGGNPVEWIFKELTAVEVEKIIEDKGMADFTMNLAVASCVYPDFKSSSLLQELGVGTPMKAVEMATSSAKTRNRMYKIVNDLHGFGVSAEDVIEKIKN